MIKYKEVLKKIAFLANTYVNSHHPDGTRFTAGDLIKYNKTAERLGYRAYCRAYREAFAAYNIWSKQRKKQEGCGSSRSGMWTFEDYPDRLMRALRNCKSINYTRVPAHKFTYYTLGGKKIMKQSYKNIFTLKCL